MLFLIQIHNVKILDVQNLFGGAVSSWLVRSSLDRAAVRVKSSPDRGHYVVLLGKTLITLTVPLSTQVYTWAPANLMLGVIDSAME